MVRGRLRPVSAVDVTFEDSHLFRCQQVMSRPCLSCSFSRQSRSVGALPWESDPAFKNWVTGIVTRRAVHEPSTGALLLDASHRDLFGSQAVAGTFALQSLKLRNASYSARVLSFWNQKQARQQEWFLVVLGSY